MSFGATFIAWALTTVGATLIVTRSGIFGPFRALFPKPKGSMPFFGTLLRCMMCLGWWFGGMFAGVQVGFDGAVPVGTVGHVDPTVLNVAWFVFSAACAGSILSWFAYLVHKKLGGEELLKQERHPWVEVPEAARADIYVMLRSGLERATMQLELVPDSMEAKARAEAHRQALDLLAGGLGAK